jgi:ribosomal protein L35
MTKTNKSLAKRVRVTRTGKVLARRAGLGHFNAKARRVKQIQGKRAILLTGYTKKELKRLLPTHY